MLFRSTAVVTEGCTPAEVAAAYGVSRSWVYELVARYRAEGAVAFEPQSRRPRVSPRAIPEARVSLIAELRKPSGNRVSLSCLSLASPQRFVKHVGH